ncbi:MAG: hypothetical protein A2868_02325 [Candidatus Levybacteria bacterium RIFCSPHIGHO2_01_FULL_40_15b]|nr:MAG: hypothetical protein A2868_02325 [Candidatus Levybacteria bacterium RIFCSPHIGHO2_01_FULL_40_15b]
MIGGPEAVGRMEESASSQPVAIITGASRDIGRGIAEELSREGFAVIANHRDPQKEKRNTEIREIIESTGGEWHVGDITTPEGRSGLADIVDRRGGKLDLLVLNAAGPSRELNVVANMALIDAFLPRMSKGGVIIFPQSTAGHFVDLIDPSQMTASGYENVAPSKNEAERELKMRMEKMDEQGVKFFIPVPPEVSDTTNIRLFSFRDKDALAKSAAFSRSLGLPERMTIRDVGKKVAELVRRKDELPQGYTDFFNGTIDARSVLRTIYDGDNAVYVDTLEENGVGHSIVSELRLEEANLRLVEEAEGDLYRATATVQVKPEHTIGHFGVLPGHKGVRAAVETLQRIFEKDDPRLTLQLASVQNVAFIGIIVPGNIMNIAVEDISEDLRDLVYNAVISVDGQICHKIEGMRFGVTDKPDGESLRPDQLAEVMAQGMGLSTGGFSLEHQDKLPLFNSFSEARFGRMPQRGETLRVESSIADTGGDERRVEGAVRIFCGEDLVAEAGSLKASMWPANFVRSRIARAQIAAT